MGIVVVVVGIAVKTGVDVRAGDGAGLNEVVFDVLNVCLCEGIDVVGIEVLVRLDVVLDAGVEVEGFV